MRYLCKNARDLLLHLNSHGIITTPGKPPVCTRTLETEQIVWELGPIFTEREMFGHDLNKTKNQSMMWVLPALQPRLKALILDSKAYKDKNAIGAPILAFSTTLEDYSSSMRPGSGGSNNMGVKFILMKN
ncbi:conserved hypothetical protein [Coccidioides posadasii str. Silveira]|uniref:Uncharacterized protein n=1 Tax=Coccidioides posadasii (strain RMSCC 757 / Silveira) TaxID=443226 RepID=E9CXM2_COCPS|nr:conserved hypothetical protein [Coccidioides posadasii str. Silveira]